jgi:acetyl-CoA acetyltransferase
VNSGKKESEGTIANWHILGATGAIQIASLLPELKRQSQEVGVVSMCIGKSVVLHPDI